MREYDPTWGHPMPDASERLERRQEARNAAYTDAITNALLASASGVPFNPRALAVAEIAAGQWGRAFASATVEPAGPLADAVTPEVLELIGRSLIRRGECVFELRVSGAGRVMLLPAAEWDVHGGPDPDGWSYRLDRIGPDGQRSVEVPAARVAHFRYAVDPIQPWQGVSPLDLQTETAGLAAALELRLRQEAAGQVGNLIALPASADKTSFEQNLGKLDGRVLLVPTTAGGWDAGPGEAPRRDWQASRLGANPPAALLDMRQQTTRQVLAACGVPSTLIDRSDGTDRRESWRQFLFGTIAPVGLLVAKELSFKLDGDVRLGWEELRASDLAGRARAFQSMVTAGMDVSKAAALAGLMMEDD